MKKIFVLALALCLMATTAFAALRGGVIYQVGPMQSLAKGGLEGSITVGELKQHGDTGIGTFDGLNGEMIVLDGVVYQAIADSSIVRVDDSVTVPFSNVAFFNEDFSKKLRNVSTKAELEKQLNALVEKNGRNSFYVIKLEGLFNSIHFRSEYAQKKPYPTLLKALEKDQTEFTLDNIDGTIVGLYCPAYMSGLNAVGWHFHFITADRRHGGHVMELNLKNGVASLDEVSRIEMIVPDTKEFHARDFAVDINQEIRKAEHGNVR